MVNVVNISVYDLNDYIQDDYVDIGIFRETSSASETYVEITSAATRIDLISGIEYYQYIDETSGTDSLRYRFKYFTSGGSATNFICQAFYGYTSDLTEDLRYWINDENSECRRYNIKELRRFINNACRNLQLTSYKNKFKADYYGIINPRTYQSDQGLILLQAQIEVAKSQMIKAADINMSYRDGRGSYNIRTSDALRDTIKLLTNERDMLIKSTNHDNISVARYGSTNTIGKQ